MAVFIHLSSPHSGPSCLNRLVNASISSDLHHMSTGRMDLSQNTWLLQQKKLSEESEPELACSNVRVQRLAQRSFRRRGGEVGSTALFYSSLLIESSLVTSFVITTYLNSPLTVYWERFIWTIHVWCHCNPWPSEHGGRPHLCCVIMFGSGAVM